MEVKNNPAGRLHDLLRVAQKQPVKEKARNAWANVFDVDPGDTGLLLEMLADLMGLVSDTKTSIERLEDVDHALYLKPFKNCEVDRLVTKFMGETSAKLRQIFDLIQKEVGVYLFDEFDALGGERSLENDVGEMRRVLNAFLQFIEQDTSDSVIVAATNSPKLLDRALFRRFDDVMYYEQPSDEERKRLIKNVLGTYLGSRFSWKQVTTGSNGLSHAEIDQACRDTIKKAILSERTKVNATELLSALKERKAAHKGLRE